MFSPEKSVDELVQRLFEDEQKAIAGGLDYSEQEVRVAVRNMSKPIATLPIGLGMITTSLRRIRLLLAWIVALLAILVCVVLLK